MPRIAHRSFLGLPSLFALVALSFALAACADGTPSQPPSMTPTPAGEATAPPRVEGSDAPTPPAELAIEAVEDPLVALTIGSHMTDARRIAIGGDGTVFVGADDMLYTVDAGEATRVAPLPTPGRLVGLAVGAGYPDEPHVYALFADSEAGSQLLRVTLEEDEAPVSEVIAEYEGGPTLSGNALAIGTDGALYAAVAEVAAASQPNLETLVRAVTRSSESGEPAAIDGLPDCLALDSAEAQLAWQLVPTSARTIADGNGPATADLARWSAVAGLAHYESERVADWADSIFVATIRGRLLRAPVEDGCADLRAGEVVYPDHGQVADVATSADGALHLLVSGVSGHSSTSTPRVLRILPTEEVDLLYPDLQTQVPSDVVMDTGWVDDAVRPVLRFTNVVENLGQGPLEVHSSGDGEEVVQRIYARDGSYMERHSGEVAYHWSHGHWHFNDFNRFELWTEEAYARYLAGEQAEPEWAHDKVSMCLMDYIPADETIENYAEYAKYTTVCQSGAQGISVGWGDIYVFDIPEQWVVLDEELGSGDYVLRSIVDSENRFHESRDGANEELDSRGANGATIWFALDDGEITVKREETGIPGGVASTAGLADSAPQPIANRTAGTPPAPASVSTDPSSSLLCHILGLH